MRSPFHGCMITMLIVPVILLALPGMAMDKESVQAIFADPGREYSSAPLWVWNDWITEAKVTQSMESFKAQGVEGVFIHPRPGLMTPYLLEDWFTMAKFTLAEAERLDMNVWIYDENSYPSCFAGGYVPEAMPESRALGFKFRDLKFSDLQDPQRTQEGTIGIYRLCDGEIENVTDTLQSDGAIADGKYLEAYWTEAPQKSWYAGFYHTDLLIPGVTETFLEVTLDPWRRELGHAFGDRVPGSFTDEPHLSGGGGMHWNTLLEDEFQARWDYSLVDTLPSLNFPEGDWKRARHNYYRLLNDLFVERWAIPYHDYCEKYDLEMTGHYWEHGWPFTTGVSDNMAMYAWMQRPGVDTLFNRYDEVDSRAQFGNVRAVLELGSIANQLGKERTLCEAYGGSGWDVRLEDLKRIGDWLYVLGVNHLNQHLSHITLRGARKGDYPISFSYHTPWFKHYREQAVYFARLSAVLSQGKSANDVLLLEPTTTAWMYQHSRGKTLKDLGNDFQALVTMLAQAQLEFDLGCESVIGVHGTVKDGKFIVGQQEYHTVLVPPHMENMEATTLALLKEYMDQGGVVLDCGPTEGPLRIDGAISKKAKALRKHKNWQVTATNTVMKDIFRRDSEMVHVIQENDVGTLYHMRRVLDDSEILFLVNTDLDSPATGAIISRYSGVERWDPKTGETRLGVPHSRRNNGLEISYSIPPCGSLLLWLYDGESFAPPKEKNHQEIITPTSPLAIARMAPNVLTLDYVDLTLKDSRMEGTHFYRACTAAFQAHGMEVNPWDHAVQFRDELISKTFPEDSGFEAAYRFTIDGDVPEDIAFVLERPDLYTVTFNDTPLLWDGSSWWLDKDFGKMDIAALARTGMNLLEVKAAPFTIYHEIAPAYVVGDFAVKPVESGFVIAENAPIELGSWKDQGMPLYGDAIAYEQRFDIQAGDGTYLLELPEWYGAVAQVAVNGEEAGLIYAQPYECDITQQLKPGANTIRVAVYGTLKNTLGPHHGKPGLGFAGPGSFRKGPESGPPPGVEYSTLDYGLFAPMKLRMEQ